MPHEILDRYADRIDTGIALFDLVGGEPRYSPLAALIHGTGRVMHAELMLERHLPEARLIKLWDPFLTDAYGPDWRDLLREAPVAVAA
jgi:hypothetical protein